MTNPSLSLTQSSLTKGQLPTSVGPFGAFFHYAARYWTAHLDGAPVDFSLDGVIELASPTSARHRAWMVDRDPWYLPSSPGVSDSPLCFLVEFANVSMLEQLLDRLAQNGNEDRRHIVDAATTAIHYRKLGHFRALMNHRSTAMRTVEMLDIFVNNWPRNFGSDEEQEEWTRLITGLFDTLASDTTIPTPNHLLWAASARGCMPVIDKIHERAKADPEFQKLM